MEHLCLGCYERLPGISTIDGITDSPYDLPDGCSHVYRYEDSFEWCEEKCSEDEECDVYSHHSQSHPDYVWRGECVLCREDAVGDNRVPSIYVSSGIKLTCEDEGMTDTYISILNRL